MEHPITVCCVCVAIPRAKWCHEVEHYQQNVAGSDHYQRRCAVDASLHLACVRLTCVHLTCVHLAGSYPPNPFQKQCRTTVDQGVGLAEHRVAGGVHSGQRWGPCSLEEACHAEVPCCVPCCGRAACMNARPCPHTAHALMLSCTMVIP